MDQLSNFVAYSPQAQAITDGQPSSSDSDGSRPRLNPAFVCWLMGLPPLWTNPDATSFVQQEMAAYRCALRSRLLALLGEC